jgi:hypothetical protein
MLVAGDFATFLCTAYNASELLIHIQKDEKCYTDDCQCLGVLQEFMNALCLSIVCHALGRRKEDAFHKCNICVI